MQLQVFSRLIRVTLYKFVTNHILYCSTSPNGRQAWCGMDISFGQTEGETYFFASDLANLKEYRALKFEKMPIWQEFGQDLIYKQEAGLNKVEMYASGFTSPVSVNFEKIMDWIDEYVRKRAPWLDERSLLET